MWRCKNCGSANLLIRCVAQGNGETIVWQRPHDGTLEIVDEQCGFDPKLLQCRSCGASSEWDWEDPQGSYLIWEVNK